MAHDTYHGPQNQNPGNTPPVPQPDMYQVPTQPERRGRLGRKGVAVLATVATALGVGAGVGASKFFGGDGKTGAEQPGNSSTFNPSAGEQSPGSESTSEPAPNPTPTDIKSSLHEGDKNKNQTELAMREPFYNQAITGEAFTPAIVDAETYSILVKKDPDAFGGAQKGYPSLDTLPKGTMTPEKLFNSKAYLDKMIEDGTLQQAMEEYNSTTGLKGGKITLTDFLVTPAEIPKSEADKAKMQALAKKAALAPEKIEALAIVMERTAGPVFKGNEIKTLPLFVATRLQSMTQEEQDEITTIAKYPTSIVKTSSIPNPESVLLVNNYDTSANGVGEAGMVIESSSAVEGGKSLKVPLFSVLAEIEQPKVTGRNYETFAHDQVRWFTTAPASEKVNEIAGVKDASYLLLAADTRANIK